MSTAAAERFYNPDELLAMADGGRYQLVGGRLVEKDMGAFSSWVAGRILHLPGFFWAGPGRRLGPARGYRLPVLHRGSSRRSASRTSPSSGGDAFRATASQNGHIPIPPDLAVEVVSPNDRFYKVDAKVTEYPPGRHTPVRVVDP